MDPLDELNILFADDDDDDVNPGDSFLSPSTTAASGAVDEARSPSSDDGKSLPTKISPPMSSRKLYSLDQQFSVSKGSHLRNSVKFLIHMCLDHFSALPVKHRRLIEQVTSKGHNLDAINFPKEALDKDLFGFFGNYLVNHARKQQDASKGELKYGTLVNYFSGVKTWFTEQHPTYSLEDHPMCFTRDWPRLRANLLKAAKQRCCKDGVPLVLPRVTATDDDTKVIAVIGLASGTIQMVDFISFGALAYHIGGRGNETSTRQFNHFETTKHYSMGLKGTLLKLFIHRDKTYSQQTNTIFPYADLHMWWKDVYFNLALSMLMKCHNQQSDLTNSDSPLFPEFYNAGSIDTDKLEKLEKKYDKQSAEALQNGTNPPPKKSIPSAVTGLYNSIFEKVVNVYSNDKTFELQETLNKKLGAHSMKKGVCQDLGDSGCNPLAIIFRVGWELRSLHSFFKYIYGSATLEKEAGMTAAGWRNKDAGDRIGGIPTTLTDALQLSDKNDHFNERILLTSLRDAFFAGSGIEESLQNIFFCSFMCRWNFFEMDCVLVSSPGKQHEIITLVRRVLRLTDVNDDMFDRWCKSSSNQFRIKNMNALAYENISDIPYDTQCDARTILQTENRHKQAINLLSKELTAMKETDEITKQQNTELSHNLKSLQNDVSILLQAMKQQHPTNPIFLVSTSTSESQVSNNTIPLTASPYDLTLNHSFHGWFVNDSIRLRKDVIEIFIHWNKYSLSNGHMNDKRNKTTHSSFAKYSKLYKTMQFILQPSTITTYPHNSISDQVMWEKKYVSLLSEQFILLGLVGKSKKRTAPINRLEKYARDKIQKK